MRKPYHFFSKATLTFILTLGIGLLPHLCVNAQSTIEVLPEAPQGVDVIISQPIQEYRGNTSIRYVPNEARGPRNKTTVYPDNPPIYYYLRDRDLGQTFTTPNYAVRLKGITLRTGPADNAVTEGAFGAEVFLQIFEVSGTPVINDNGTNENSVPRPERVIEWSTDLKFDDFIEGEVYDSLYFTQSTLPGYLTKNQWIRWNFPSSDEIVLQANKQYAFLIGFVHPSTEQKVAFANVYGREYFGETYLGGHAIRREGSIEQPWNDPDTLWATLEGCAFPTDFNQRLKQQPSTWGQPDIDTFRDFTFFIQGDRILPQNSFPWLETFSDLADFATEDNGPTGWISAGSNPLFAVVQENNNKFFGVNAPSSNEGIWRSYPIDISQRDSLQISVDIWGATDLATDYIEVYYQIDSSEVVLLTQRKGSYNQPDPETIQTVYVSTGKTMHIIIKSQLSSTDPSHFYAWDNIEVKGGTALEKPTGFASLEEKINLYPNPSEGEATLVFPETLGKVQDISLVHQTGQTQALTITHNGVSNLTLEVKDKKPGVYLLKVQWENTVKVFKLFIK